MSYTHIFYIDEGADALRAQVTIESLVSGIHSIVFRYDLLLGWLEVMFESSYITEDIHTALRTSLKSHTSHVNTRVEMGSAHEGFSSVLITPGFYRTMGGYTARIDTLQDSRVWTGYLIGHTVTCLWDIEGRTQVDLNNRAVQCDTAFDLKYRIDQDRGQFCICEKCDRLIIQPSTAIFERA